MKKLLPILLVILMLGIFTGYANSSEYDLTLFTVWKTNPNFDQWLSGVESATGLKINAIAEPTDTDTRQQ